MTVFAVVAWLTAHQCSLAGAAGIVANLQIESGLNPAIIGRSGIGLPQYAGIRRRRLLGALGARWTEGVLQLDFIRREAIELDVWQRVCAMRDAALAARVWMLDFEQPRSRAVNRREALARQTEERLR